jgi:MFS family permease
MTDVVSSSTRGVGSTAVAPRPAVDPRIDSGRGWVVVAAAALATFTLFAITYSFGTAFTAMAAEFNAGNGAIALMFGFVIFFLFTLGLPAGRITDRVGPRPVMAVGTVSMTVGLWLTSIIHSLWIGYATYGVGVGVGVACCYVPMVSQVSAWFDRRRATALGLASAGIGLGTLVGPKVTQRLIATYEWRSTFRILAVFAAVALAVATGLAAQAPGSAGAVVPSLRETFSRPAFRRFYLSGLLLGLGLFVPFVFLVPYAKVHGIAPSTAASLISLLGLGSLSGRLLLSAVAGRLGLARLYKLCIFGMGSCFLIWLFAGSSFVALAAFALVLGLSYGGYVALSPAVCAHMFGIVGLGGVLGALYTSSGVGGLVGPPLAGWLIDVTGSYTAAIVLALVLASGAVVALPRLEPAAESPAARPQRGRSGASPRRSAQLTVWPVGKDTDAVPLMSW